jgi:putative tributyrin esterase
MKLIVAFFLLFRLFLLSAQEQHIFKSSLIPGDDTVCVIIPASYDTLVYYPAIYMLHGKTGNYRSWNELTNLQEYADEYGIIIICPDGFSDSYYLNSPVDSNWQFESFFTDVLYPGMLKIYSIDETKIFITGLSMGGSGAMYIFLKHPGLFLSAGSSSGVMDLNYSSSKLTSLSRLLGDYDLNRQLFDSCSPVNLLQNIAGSDKQLFFDCGTEDYLYECNNAFRKKCDELKIKATYISQPGKHERQYWQKTIRYHFEFFHSLVEN